MQIGHQNIQNNKNCFHDVVKDNSQAAQVNSIADSWVIGKFLKPEKEVDETSQKLCNINWQVEQSKDTVISRVMDLVSGGVKISGNNLQQELESVRLKNFRIRTQR